jgi:hypothetical protein
VSFLSIIKTVLLSTIVILLYTVKAGAHRKLTMLHQPHIPKLHKDEDREIKRIENEL